MVFRRSKEKLIVNAKGVVNKTFDTFGVPVSVSPKVEAEVIFIYENIESKDANVNGKPASVEGKATKISVTKCNQTWGKNSIKFL